MEPLIIVATRIEGEKTMEHADKQFVDPKAIAPQEAYERMKQGGVIVIDVRGPDEYAKGHVKNAHNIPADHIESRAGSDLPDKNASILVYCHSGFRAAAAVKTLQGLGYKNAVSFGGIIAWPYEIVT
jgi:rhodanese-related sulfurtransferase